MNNGQTHADIAGWNGAVLRFSPDGQVSTFDAVGTQVVAVDRFGNVFTTGNGTVYRFDCEDSTTKHEIVSGIVAQSMIVGTTPDSKVLYLVANGIVYSVDPILGGSVPLADLRYLSAFARSPLGITVFWPSVAGDLDVDADVDLSDVAIFQNCQGAGVDSHDCTCVPSDLNRDALYDLLDWPPLATGLTGPLS